MTRKEMTEVFSVMMLAWPSAEMFKGGIQKLGPTIELWTSCLIDVDFWTAQQAVVRLCRECKFPPTIAEFKEKVDNVNAEIRAKTTEAFSRIRTGEFLRGSATAYFEQLPDDSFDKAVILAMGGPERLTVKLDKGGSMWNIREFENTYLRLLRKTTALSTGQNKVAMIADKKEG